MLVGLADSDADPPRTSTITRARSASARPTENAVASRVSEPGSSSTVKHTAVVESAVFPSGHFSRATPLRVAPPTRVPLSKSRGSSTPPP